MAKLRDRREGDRVISPEVSRLAARAVNSGYVSPDVRAAINAASTDEEMLAAIEPLTTALTATAWDESKHPREQAGRREGGRFRGNGATITAPRDAMKAWQEVYGRSALDPHIDNLTDEEQNALALYQTSGYAPINFLLRDPADFSTWVRDPEVLANGLLGINPYDPNERYHAIALEKGLPVALDEAAVDVTNLATNYTVELDHAMRPAPAAHLVYRANSGEPDEPEAITDVYGEIGPSIVGKVVTDKGFSSTTLSEKFALERSSGGGILHRIAVPAGTPSFYYPAGLPTTAFDDESELLLGRGTRFKATGYHEDSEGRKVVDWEIVP